MLQKPEKNAGLTGQLPRLQTVPFTVRVWLLPCTIVYYAEEGGSNFTVTNVSVWTKPSYVTIQLKTAEHYTITWCRLFFSILQNKIRFFLQFLTLSLCKAKKLIRGYKRVLWATMFFSLLSSYNTDRKWNTPFIRSFILSLMTSHK